MKLSQQQREHILALAACFPVLCYVGRSGAVPCNYLQNLGTFVDGWSRWKVWVRWVKMDRSGDLCYMQCRCGKMRLEHLNSKFDCRHFPTYQESFEPLPPPPSTKDGSQWRFVLHAMQVWKNETWALLYFWYFYIYIYVCLSLYVYVNVATFQYFG